jgi:hypothetical protein
MSTDISDEKAIISIEVQLVSAVTGDPTPKGESGFFEGIEDDSKQSFDELVKSSVDDAVSDALEESEITNEEAEKLTQMIKGVDSNGISNVNSMAKNPEGFMQNTIMSVLSKAGPYGALAAAIITAVAATPEMVKAVVQALGVKGGPLNQDYAYTEEEQFNQQFSRAVQFKRLTGDDPVITVTTKGFVSGDADFNDNSLLSIETGRMGRVDLRQNSLGMIQGI